MLLYDPLHLLTIDFIHHRLGRPQGPPGECMDTIVASRSKHRGTTIRLTLTLTLNAPGGDDPQPSGLAQPQSLRVFPPKKKNKVTKVSSRPTAFEFLHLGEGLLPWAPVLFHALGRGGVRPRKDAICHHHLHIGAFRIGKMTGERYPALSLAVEAKKTPVPCTTHSRPWNRGPGMGSLYGSRARAGAPNSSWSRQGSRVRSTLEGQPCRLVPCGGGRWPWPWCRVGHVTISVIDSLSMER